MINHHKLSINEQELKANDNETVICKNLVSGLQIETGVQRIEPSIITTLTPHLRYYKPYSSISTLAPSFFLSFL